MTTFWLKYCYLIKVLYFCLVKRTTSYISCIIIIFLFLASSTGISFVIHHCSNNHSEEIRFFTNDYQCSHENPTDDCHRDNKGQHHCEKHSNHHCCKNTKGYFKIADEYTASRTDIKIIIPIIDNKAIVISAADIHPEIIISNYFYKQTTSFSGADIYCLNSQFLIWFFLITATKTLRHRLNLEFRIQNLELVFFKFLYQ